MGKKQYEIDDQVVGSEPKTMSMKKAPAAKKVASKKKRNVSEEASEVAKPVAKAKAMSRGKAKSKAAAKTNQTKAKQGTATKDNKKKAAGKKSVNDVEKMERAKMAMDVYWTWEKEWVKAMQIHSQRVSIWQWIDILDVMHNSSPAARFSVSLDSRGVYVLHAPSFRIVSMRARSYAFDNFEQNSSPYTIQDIDDGSLSDANDTDSDVEVNLLRDL